MVRGTPVFDGLALFELEVNFVQQTATATAAFINTATGATHGSTTASGNVWSHETLSLLSQLRESIERDLAKKHLTVLDDGVKGVKPTGLAEYLESTPSI